MTPQIRQFTDYRAFLRSYVQFKKKSRAGWSIGVWARKLGLKATSSLTKILQGEREPGPALIESLVKYFGFHERDAQYFRDLIRLSKIRKDPGLATMILSRLDRELSNRGLRVINDAAFRMIANWYCLPLRELTLSPDFQENPEVLASAFRFPVSSKEIRQAIATLLELGLLTRDQNGKLTPAETHVDTPNDISSEAIKRYHEAMLDHARTAVREIDVLDREFSAESFLMKKEDLPRAKELIREFRRKLVSLFENTRQGDDVYQLQIQLFPLTKRKRGSP